MRSSKPAPGEIYIELRAVGNAVKVSAIDAATGTEISIMGPKNASRAELESTAVAKLQYVLEKKKKSGLS